MASPTNVIVFTRSRATASQTPSGSKRGMSTMRSPQKNPMNTPSCAAPWISGGTGNCTTTARVFAFSASSSGLSIGTPAGFPPPIPVKNRSSWRHTTPFGMPVVPPV
jgi:hypothetical protein